MTNKKYKSILYNIKIYKKNFSINKYTIIFVIIFLNKKNILI